MDPLALAVTVLAVLALIGGVVLALRVRRLRSAVDDALDRIGDRPAKTSYDRVVALRSGVDRLEESAARSERVRSALAGAVHEAPIGVIITDDHGVITVVNDAATSYMGARLGEAVTEVRVREIIERAVLDRESVAFDLELYTPVRRFLRLEAIPLDHGIESAGVVAYIIDVTEDHRIDSMRRDFIANVGHELKTPLGALAILAETLAASVDDPAVAVKLAGRVDVEARRLATLTEDLLDLSQAEGAVTHPEPVDMNAVVADSIAVVSGRAHDAGVVVTTETAAPTALVAGHRGRLRTMVINLIDNAVRYSDPRPDQPPPTVTVRVGVEDDDMVLEVEDEGIGIDDAHRPRVFERFYRVDQARSDTTGGTGLGLAIVRNTAVAHGGSVSVRSGVGVGSSFTVRLPRWSG